MTANNEKQQALDYLKLQVFNEFLEKMNDLKFGRLTLMVLYPEYLICSAGIKTLLWVSINPGYSIEMQAKDAVYYTLPNWISITISINISFYFIAIANQQSDGAFI